MKKVISISVLLLCIGIFAWSCGDGAKAKSTEANTAISGSQLYSENCVVCHGEDGKAGMSGATDLSASVLSHDNTVAVITNGRNGMRAFSNQFSKEEIDALAKHVESLRK